MRYSKIVASGSYLPEKILTNQELESMVDTSDEWITSRSGIKNRHLIANNQTTSDMAYEASCNALKDSQIDVASIDMIIVATFTPDSPFPSTACLLQNRLGLINIPAFDVNAVCSGFMYALATADAYIRANMAQTILVVGADATSHFIDYTDRNTCVLFGDGAGAVILKASDTPGIIANELHADGGGKNALIVPGSFKHGAIHGNPYLHMDGKAVFKMAVKNLEQVAKNLLKNTGYTQEQLDWLIPHQANIRIIQSTAQNLGLDMDKVIVTLPQHGNTAAASVPLALDYAIKSGKIQPGNLIMLEGVGAGFTWGASLIRY